MFMYVLHVEAHLCANVHVYMCVHMEACLCADMHAYMCVCVHVEAHLCANMQVLVEALGMETQMTGVGNSLWVFGGYTQSASCRALFPSPLFLFHFRCCNKIP